MRVATHLFSLVGVTVEELLRADDPSRIYPTCPAGSIRPQDLARLGEALGVGPHESILDDFSLVAGESQAPPWVVALPHGLTTALRDLKSGEVASVAAQWAAAEEVGESHTDGDLLRFLEAAGRFLRDNGGPIVLYIAAATP